MAREIPTTGSASLQLRRVVVPGWVLPGAPSPLRTRGKWASKGFTEGCEVLVGLDLTGRREMIEEGNHQSWSSLRKTSDLIFWLDFGLSSTLRPRLVITGLCDDQGVCLWTRSWTANSTRPQTCLITTDLSGDPDSWSNSDPVTGPSLLTLPGAAGLRPCWPALCPAPALPPAAAPVSPSLKGREPAPAAPWQMLPLWSKGQDTEGSQKYNFLKTQKKSNWLFLPNFLKKTFCVKLFRNKSPQEGHLVWNISPQWLKCGRSETRL